MNELKKAFRFYREKGSIARAAIERAREDVAAGKARYPVGMRSGCIGAAGKDGLQWCEWPSAIGLRFVGWADDLAGRRVSHFGWYCDAFQEETYRGAVYQFPARNGVPLYVIGYREGSTGNRRSEWSDTSGNPAARLDLANLIRGTKGGENAEDDLRDAAIQADSLAENAAEEARDYSEHWQKGSQYADLGEEVKTMRRDALKLIAEIKAHGRFTPEICATLRASVSGLLAEIAEARALRAAALEEVWSEYRDAFNEGAGIRA